MLIGLSHILEMMKRIGSLVRCVFHVRGIFFWMEKRDDFLTEKFRKIFRLTCPAGDKFFAEKGRLLISLLSRLIGEIYSHHELRSSFSKKSPQKRTFPFSFFFFFSLFFGRPPKSRNRVYFCKFSSGSLA